MVSFAGLYGRSKDGARCRGIVTSGRWRGNPTVTFLVFCVAAWPSTWPWAGAALCATSCFTKRCSTRRLSQSWLMVVVEIFACKAKFATASLFMYAMCSLWGCAFVCLSESNLVACNW